MKKVLSVLLILALCLALCLPALAAEPETLRVTTASQLLAALGSNRTVVLAEGVYDLHRGDWAENNALMLEGLEHLTLRGEGRVELMNESRSELVLSLFECKDVTLENLIMGHGELPGGCDEGVAEVNASSGIVFRNCELYGCGKQGLYAHGNSSLLLEDCVIRDCSCNAMGLYAADVIARNCRFEYNGYDEAWSKYYACINAWFSALRLIDCSFRYNSNPHFLNHQDSKGGESSTMNLSGCVFEDNAWPAAENLFVGVKEVGGFEDVPVGAYYTEAVRWAKTAEPVVTKGVDASHFAPCDRVTRGQAVTFLWRAMGEPEPSGGENPFTDVKESDYFYKSVLWAVEQGITNGTSATEFSPAQTCSNAHILTFVWRCLGKPEATEDSPGKDWYSDAYAWAERRGDLEAPGIWSDSLMSICPRCDVVYYLWRALA